MKHIVHKDQLFGYPVGSTQKQTLRMVVMRVDVSKGGDPTLIDRTISVGKVDIREAGPKDYERFGVDNPGVKEFQVGDIISAIVYKKRVMLQVDENDDVTFFNETDMALSL